MNSQSKHERLFDGDCAITQSSGDEGTAAVPLTGMGQDLLFANTLGQRTRKAVTRVDLCEAVYQKVGLSRTESSAFVELVLKEITDCLEKSETVKLSSFGSFMVRKKSQRVGRNPKTGIEVPISPRRVVVFKPSAIMKQQINSQPPGSSAGAETVRVGR